MTRLLQKTRSAAHRYMGVQREVRRNLRAWAALYGIWRGKKPPDPIRWQRRVRREWERKLS